MHKDADNLNALIASNLRELRKKRGITLDDMAEMTGVSKSMLGQIERGESGLSVATLWKISTGLKVSFNSLMSESTSEAVIIENKANDPMETDAKGFRLYPLFLLDKDRTFDTFYFELDPKGESRSEAHKEGTQEFVMVTEGCLTLTAGGSIYEVQADCSAMFAADQPHAYANKGDKPVKVFNIVYYKD